MVVPTRTKINLGFGLTLAFLAVISVFTYRESLLSIQAVGWVNQTHETLEQLSTVLSLVLEAENARRGYVLTGDRSFLDRYDAIPTRLASSLQRLRESTAGRPEQQAHLDELEPLIRRKLENLATSIQLRERQGATTAEQESMTREGKKITDQIEFLDGELRAQQGTLLTERTARSQVSARRAVEIALLGSFLALVTILTLLLMFNIDISKRRHAEEVLRSSQERFRSFVENAPIGIYRTTPAGQILMANPALVRMLGYKDLAELTLRSLEGQDFEPSYPRQEFRERIEREGEVRGLETAWRRRDGSTIFVRESGRAVRGESGEVLYYDGVVEDITEHKRAEEALEASARQLAQAIDLARLAEWEFDVASGLFTFNDRFYALYGTAAEREGGYQMSAETYAREFLLPEDVHVVADAIARSQATADPNASHQLEHRIRRRDGEIRHVAVRISVIRDPQGRTIKTRGVNQDITARKRAEEALLEERYLLHTLMDNVPDYIYFKDLDSRFKRISIGLARSFGLSDPAQAVGKTDFDFFSDEHARQAYADEQGVIRTGRPMQAIEEKETWPDGHETWVSTTKMPLRDAQGRITGTFGVSRDITPRKRAEQALQESEERYRDLAENAAELIQSVSPEGQLLYVNRAWRETLGYSAEEVPHLHVRDVVHPERLPHFQEVLDSVMQGKAINDVETVFVTKTGERIAVQGSVNCRLVDGKPVAMRGIFRDVTARLEIERLKNEFVSTVSHELRTPLTSIRGALGLLTSGMLNADPAKARRMLDIALGNTDRLIRLINDILDIERIESGRVKLEMRSCSAASLMAQAEDSVREVANKAGVKLELFPTSGNVLADSDRIVQTLTNLLGNAIKFSLPGMAVTLSAKRSDDEMLFEVRDQGRGIPADKLGVIFERFQQVDASDEREKGGTGLGLAICRSIVDQHGGRIWVESQLGRGSSFYFTLPLVKEQVETSVPEASPGQRTVLICDDDLSIRAVVQTLLEQHDYCVLAAGSGKEAIEQATARQPDVILLDLLMPEMDGWETLAALRERPETRETPVIILSVLPPRETRKSDGKVAGWVQKPVDEGQLFQTLSAAISRSSKPARVLVVEDDLDLARVIQAVFERHGNTVIHAQTGREAIQSAQRVLPNLVVLDLVLPEGDGFEVVAGLRCCKALRSVPLVVYTAKDIDAAERERLKLGETVFLTKGRISPEEFERRVIGLLDRLMSG
jgi:hypothetical protein